MAGLPSVGSLISVGDETQDGGIICKLKDDVGTVCGDRVMRVQGEGETAHPHHIGSARQEVQDPDAKGGV